VARAEIIIPDDKVIVLIRDRVAQGWAVRKCEPYDATSFTIELSRVQHRNPKDINLHPEGIASEAKVGEA
jgi:hypothetical protein